MQPLPFNTRFVIPAAPGFFAIFLLFAENGRDVVGTHKEPIVGWAIDEHNVVLPTTVDSVTEDYYAILNPDGKVQSPTGEWQTLDELCQAVKDDFKP